MQGGVRIERSNYVPCRVAEWRVVFEKPADIKMGPLIPEEAVWKTDGPTRPANGSGTCTSRKDLRAQTKTDRSLACVKVHPYD